MQKIISYICYLLLITTSLFAQEPHTFTDTKGDQLTGVIIKYEYADEIAVIEINGSYEKIPLAKFCPEDREYLLRWNMANAFRQSMRFGIEVEKTSWKQMRWTQTITPYWMDTVGIPGKTIPLHRVVMLEDYEETAALYLEAIGYSINIKNKNMFPIDDVVVHHKIFYEQEDYLLPEDINKTTENEYNDVITTNKSKQATEIIPSVGPLEDISLNSKYAMIVDSQIERTMLITETTDDSGDEDEEEAEVTELEGFGDWDDSSRRRRGDMIGIWVIVGMKDAEGNMLYREVTHPDSLKSKVIWDFDAYLESVEIANKEAAIREKEETEARIKAEAKAKADAEAKAAAEAAAAIDPDNDAYINTNALPDSVNAQEF